MPSTLLIEDEPTTLAVFQELLVDLAPRKVRVSFNSNISPALKVQIVESNSLFQDFGRSCDKEVIVYWVRTCSVVLSENKGMHELFIGSIKNIRISFRCRVDMFNASNPHLKGLPARSKEYSHCTAFIGSLHIIIVGWRVKRGSFL